MLTRLPSRDELVAERCRRSLSRLVREAWPIVEPATEFVHGWHVDVMAEHLEAVSAGELRRLIINIPPRAMKSLTTCVFWPAWEWLSAPHIRWLFASYAENFAHRDSLKMRRLIRSEGGREDGTIFQRVGYQGVLRLLTDEPWELTKDQDAKSRYDNTATGMRLAVGVRGQGTGEGGDRLVVDDPTSAKQARSDADRAFANTWWDETMSTRFNNAKGAAVLVMQRLHEDDLTGHLLERGGWHHLCLPAEYEPSHPFVYPREVKLPDREVERESGAEVTTETVSGRTLPGDPRSEEGELLEPVRLGAERLAELARDLGSYGFAGQMQQRPAPEEGGMFKRSWWKRYTGKEGWQVQRTIVSWDMRFSDSQSAASSYVVGQVWAVAGARRMLVGQVRARLSFTETLAAVKAVNEWRSGPINAVLVEDKANGPAVVDTLKARIPGLIAVKPEGGKEVRAAAVSPLIEAGDIWLPEGEYIPAPLGYEATTVDEFIGEHATFPNGAHDDQVDAMSQALNWLANAPGKAKTKKLKGKVLK